MRYQINLFPPRDHNFTDKIIYFSFNYLRYILVITQLVVICVFFYRFQIDQQVVDLKDSIKQKGEIITVSEPLIKEVKALDIKMQSVERLNTDQNRVHSMYQYFLSIFPADLYLSKLDLNTEGIEMVGYTLNASAIKLYYNRLIKEKKFTSIKLENIERENDSYTFSISLKNFTGK